jgi:hypothetical protein
MKKTNKVNPVTFFRKANEARQKIVKTSLKKAQDGIEMNSQEPPDRLTSSSKPIGTNISVGNFSGGFQGNVGDNKISNTMFNAGYNNPKTGLSINAGYAPKNKKVSAGLNYNTTVGKNKIPLKLGVTYNKNGGSVNRKKK